MHLPSARYANAPTQRPAKAFAPLRTLLFVSLAAVVLELLLR